MKMNPIGAALALGATMIASVAYAQGEPTDLPVIGVPEAGAATGFQPAATELAHDIHWLDNFLHGISAIIVLFVVALLLIVFFRFNSRANPTPARFTHNTKVEIAWTLLPVLILIVIGSFSLPILFKQLEIPDHDVTVKATGNQWYWTYDYTDYEMSFDSLMLPRDELADYGYSDDLYLLATDTAVVVPVSKVVRIQTTGADVIHSWTVPAFGVKMDAVPGRLNETWFSAEEEGIYFGQCSELCGKDHSYMPITVKVVSEQAYEDWLDWALEEHGGARPGEDVAEEAPVGAAAAAEPEPAADGSSENDAESVADVEAAAEDGGEATDGPGEEAEQEATSVNEAAADEANVDAEAGDPEEEPKPAGEDAAEPAN